MKITIDLTEGDIAQLSYYCGYMRGLGMKLNEPQDKEAMERAHNFFFELRSQILEARLKQ